ncbi:iron-containing alcohol dehydrogenase [Irregularibacter muris]|uniref:Iron-containing alcohol dehydrogenase n=1 Tax=Irregularibacter muris TaxID=1796619 RepID=A0AAE3L1X5_9FIRM|nr:iron-containing alcohol dehydrogenase [Irregularibacter muris]MCR1897644.1 iron-containing alcohol dehydrogenase [Irregularibacter muris]
MLDFNFQNETKIIFGKNSFDDLSKEISKWGRKVLLVYGGNSIKKNGIYDKVVAQLDKNQLIFEEISGVKPNPRLDLVLEGIDKARKSDIDFILAVGGGSVIDTAKAIAMGAKCNKDIWSCFSGEVFENEVLPLGTILTIPAAGSESSTTTVITNQDKGLKRAFSTEELRPKFAILNPETTFTLPQKQTIAGAIDIMAHVFERYFTNTENVDLTDRLCEGLLKILIKNIPIVLEEPENYHARAEIMWAGTLAHNGLLGTGREEDWGSHMIAHEISAQYDITHGFTLSIIFPAWMKYVYKTNTNRFAQFANRVWNIEIDLDNLDRTAMEGIFETEKFFKQIGAPTRLRDLNIHDEHLENMSHKCTMNGSVGNFIKLHQGDVNKIFKLAL